MHVYHEFVARLYQNCGALKSVVLYGEYFGGWHPDANVDGVGRGIPVQQHVAYCPVHRFYAFDILVDGEWLSFDKAMLQLSRAGFPLVAEPLVRGSLEDCLSLDVNRLHTSVPT